MKFTFYKLAVSMMLALFAMLASPLVNAGHLFTQAQTNTPIDLTAGQGLNVTQNTFENSNSNGLLRVYFNDPDGMINFPPSTDPNVAWSAGDAIQFTIGSWSQTFSFDTMVANGGSQDGTSFQITSGSLAAANITPTGQTTWTVIATSGQFKWEGYRIYVVGKTFNGTGAGAINQSQVVNASQLGGGGFVPVAAPNEKGVAATLDGLGGATGQLGAVVTILSAMTDDSKRQAMKLISPDRSQVMGQSAINTVTSSLDTVQVRLDALRLGVGAESDSRIGLNSQHNSHGQQQFSGEGMASGDEALNRSFWLKAFGGKADQDGKHGYAGSDSNIIGMMAGADRMTESGWLLGAALAYAKTNVDMTGYRNGDDADIKTYQVTGYVSKSFERWYMQGMMTYAYQDYETSRNTHLTGVAKGDFGGDMYGVRLVAGMPFSLQNDMTLTPSIGIESHRINQDSYTEKGAGAISLRVGDSDATRLRSLAGLELGALKTLSDGSKLRPSLKATWKHEFNDDGMNTTASFIGGGSQFESVGQDVNRDIYGLAARLNWERTERIGVSVEVGAEKGDGYFGLNGQLMGTYRF
jgi:outer membrane autotransporter protein